jgi:hypothetical protein
MNHSGNSIWVGIELRFGAVFLDLTLEFRLAQWCT